MVEKASISLSRLSDFGKLALKQVGFCQKFVTKTTGEVVFLFLCTKDLEHITVTIHSSGFSFFFAFFPLPILALTSLYRLPYF